MRRRLFFIAILSVLSLLSAACASGGRDAINDPGTAVIVTRRDILDGDVRVLVDGKNAGKIGPIGRFGYKLRNGRHTIAVEYKKLRSRQMSFEVNSNKVEFDIWVFQNTEPNIQQRVDYY
ncbi:MAG: hypothetical protein LBC77_07960 [Spirochaetaceae bacterium]|jgi:hypothetical protein|nr:hypothetical protein [Spirochaetaceae bacterium]